MATNNGNYEVIDDDDDEQDKQKNEDDDDASSTEYEEEEEEDYSDIPSGEYVRTGDDSAELITTSPRASVISTKLNIDKSTVEGLLSGLGDAESAVQIKHPLPASSKIVYVNPGFTLVMVNLTGYFVATTARSILASSMKYIKQNTVVNKKLKLDIVLAPANIPNGSIYYQYLKALCDYVETEYHIGTGNTKTVGIPIIKVGSNELMVCGCCGIQFNNCDYVKHAEKKTALFQKFDQRRYSCCPWCDVEFDTDEAALLHWFDEGHSIVSCKNIIGETKGSVNDARVHKGLPLPYTPFIQSAISLFAQMAPLASILLCQKVTKIDLANTNELPACLSIEIANIEKGDGWTPDCAVCNKRYYLHNVVHYSSIGAYDSQVKYEEMDCGHQVPTISKKFIRDIGLSLFDDMADKLDGKKKIYGCSTYKTSSRKDQYDDEGPIRKRMSTLFESYRSTNTSETQKYRDSVFNSMYSQKGYQCVMNCNKWPLHSSHSYGIHINVQEEDLVSWCEEAVPINGGLVAADEIISNDNIENDLDELFDPYFDYKEISGPPPLAYHQINVKRQRKNNKQKINKENKQDVQWSKLRVPFQSHQYRCKKTNLPFLANRQCFVEYDLCESMEFRRYKNYSEFDGTILDSGG